MLNDEQVQRVMESVLSGLTKEQRSSVLRTWAEWLDRKVKGGPGWLSGWLIEVAEALEGYEKEQPDGFVKTDENPLKDFIDGLPRRTQVGERSPLPPPVTIGYRFHVDGQYCERLDRETHDVEKEKWVAFLPQWLFHEMDKEHFTVEVPWPGDYDEARDECIRRAVVIVEWFRQLRGWEGFEARLWLDVGWDERKVEVHRWELV